MKFCPSCGQPVEMKIPEGDHLPRAVCTACATIHYDNPRIIAGCVIEVAGKILMCKRAIEPRHGFWTIPAGFMENGESVQQAAAREAMEEALAHVQIGSPLAIVSVLRAHQVHMMFRARLDPAHPQFGIGPESLESELYAEVRNPVAGSRFSQRGVRSAPLPRRPPQWRGTAAFPHDRLAGRQTGDHRWLMAQCMPPSGVADDVRRH